MTRRVVEKLCTKKVCVDFWPLPAYFQKINSLPKFCTTNNSPRGSAGVATLSHKVPWKIRLLICLPITQGRRNDNKNKIFSKTPTGPPDPRSPKTPQQQKKKFQKPRKVDARSPKVDARSPKVDARSPKVNVKYF